METRNTILELRKYLNCKKFLPILKRWRTKDGEEEKQTAVSPK